MEHALIIAVFFAGYYLVCLFILLTQVLLIRLHGYKPYHYEIGQVVGPKLNGIFTVKILPVDAAVDYHEETRLDQPYWLTLPLVSSNMLVYGAFSLPYLIYCGFLASLAHLGDYLARVVTFRFHGLYASPASLTMTDLALGFSFGCLVIFVFHLLPGRGMALHSVLRVLANRRPTSVDRITFYSISAINYWFILCVVVSLGYWAMG